MQKQTKKIVRQQSKLRNDLQNNEECGTLNYL